MAEEATQPTSRAKRVVVLGGTGGTGREIVRVALSAGHDVSVLVRAGAKAPPGLQGVQLLEGDAGTRLRSRKHWMGAKRSPRPLARA